MADGVLAAISAGHPTVHKAAAKHQTRRTEKANTRERPRLMEESGPSLRGFVAKFPVGAS